MNFFFQVIALVCFYCSYSLASFEQRHAYIFSINDFHGFVSETKSVPGAAKLASSILKEKSSLKADNANSIIVFAGDNYYGQSISNGNYGKLVSSFAKKIGVQISAIGNHEFDWHKNLFHKWSDDSGLLFLNGNITDEYQKLNSLPKYKIVNLNGIKICFIGLTTQETLTALPHYKIKHIAIEKPHIALKNIIADIKKNESYDLIVALTHIPANQQLENGKIIYGTELTSILNVNEVNAYITAHSHEIIVDENNGKPIIQANSYGKAFGVLEITEIAPKKFQIKPRVVDVVKQKNNLTPHPEIAEIISRAENTYNAKFGKVIAKTMNNALAPRSIKGIDPLVNYMGEFLLPEYNLDMLMINGGALRDNIMKGDISISDVLALMPFDDEFLFVKMKGIDLKNILLEGLKGFDDKGILQFYGVDVDICNNNNLFHLSSTGQEIKDDQIYSVAITTHMFPKIDNLDFNKVFDKVNSGIIVREYIIELFTKSHLVTFQTPTNYKKCNIIQ
jgi:2',3'-cyclic-nucleotide 2'-phosphodiesterase (5'-nucleotidase family)